MTVKASAARKPATRAKPAREVPVRSAACAAPVEDAAGAAADIDYDAEFDAVLRRVRARDKVLSADLDSLMRRLG